MAVEQSGGTEDDLAKVADLPPVLLHCGDVVMDVAGDVVRGVGVFRAFAINVRLDRLDGFDGGGVRNEHHVVHAGERRERTHAERIVKVGAPRAFVDVLFIGDRHDQRIAKLLGILQMHDVPGVHEVERAVALDQALALAAQFVEQRGRFGERNDFGLRHFNHRLH